MQEYPEHSIKPHHIPLGMRIKKIFNAFILSWRKPPFLKPGTSSRLHKKKIPIALLLAAIFLGLVSTGFLLFFSPKVKIDHIENAFKIAGFAHIHLPEPRTTGHQIIFDDIRLDPDGFSSIQKLILHYTYFGSLKIIEIDGLSLTGEIENNFKTTLAGWNPQNTQKNWLFEKGLPLIYIKNARISVLNSKIGGINFNLDMQLRPFEKNYTLQATLSGHDAALSYTAHAQGTLQHNGLWDIQADIAQGKFALWPLKASRISGIIKAQGEAANLKSSHISGELQAGGFNIDGLPWRNALFTLDGTLEKTQAIIGARSAGIEGIGLNLKIESLQSANLYSGTLFSSSLGMLFDYLDARNLLFIPRKNLEPLAHHESIELQFRGSPRTLIFTATHNSIPFISHGQIEPHTLQYTLEDIAHGIPANLILRTPKGDFQGNIALSDDRKNLVTFPERKMLKPNLTKDSSLLDIFAPK